ncbi:hypothetical protein FSBG_00169 [Fusobacterium gonidiaformans 3-1-5R]|uniref:Uncharacterized protein n=2 Tax=Fusobacterium TaxID=848 RepID=E5BEZ1_9FUSO|nr:hypothetical protein FSBG_00169 [Fusobacterium gonidiaformans 3-1-5R]
MGLGNSRFRLGSIGGGRMKQSKLFESTSHYKFMRERAFESDLGCNTTLIGFIWELNDQIAERWRDVSMLLAINNPKNNIKMTKGLTKIANDLRKIADELESYTKEKEPECVEGVIE